MNIVMYNAQHNVKVTLTKQTPLFLKYTRDVGHCF